MWTLEAYRLYHQAQTCLVNSEADAAKELFAQAGAILEQSNSEEKQTDMIGAATCYMEAGDYTKAMDLLTRVDKQKLDKTWTEIWNTNFVLSKSRSASSWTGVTLKYLQSSIETKHWDRVISTLADAPYIVDQVHAAQLRSKACLEMGDMAAALLFEEDANRLRNKKTSLPLVN